MSFSIRQMYSAFNILKLLRKTGQFHQWLKESHPNKDASELYKGYWFVIYSCINNIIDEIETDTDFNLESDFLFDCSTAHNIPIDIIGKSDGKYEDCEKLRVLKSIKPLVKAIFKAETFDALERKLLAFEEQVSEPFFSLFNEHLFTTEQWKHSKEKALQFLQIDYLHTFLNQFGGIGPYANSTNCITTKVVRRKQYLTFLEGYAFTIQFLWTQTIGQEKVNKTALKSIHLVDSWADYKYKKERKTLSDIFSNNKFELTEQSSLESYFYWIKDEITDPLGEEYGILPYRTEDYIFFNKEKYNKGKVFSSLLKPMTKGQIVKKLSWNEKISETLYWFNLRVDNRGEGSRYEPSTSFLIALSGTVALHDPDKSEFAKVIVVRFIHPLKNKEGQHDFSYGVVEDTKSVTLHYHSEWNLFQNACSDYKANEYVYIEKQISKYEKADRLDVRELVIPLEEFKKYTEDYVLVRKDYDRKKEDDLINVVLPDARAYLLELFAYYVFTKSTDYKGFNINLNADSRNGKGEKDIVLENADEVILIECKVTLDNSDLSQLITDLKSKLKTYTQGKKSIQLWGWNKISKKSQQFLDAAVKENTELSYVIVSDTNSSPLLHGVSLRQIKDAMKYTEKEHFNWESFEIDGLIE